MILMLLWVQKETTKYMVGFKQMALNSALAAIPSALGCSGWRNPLRFIQLIRASILSLFCALANPHHAGDAYMSLDRVVAWATRWRESADNPFDRSMPRAYNDDEAEDSIYMLVHFKIGADGNSEDT